LGTVNDEARSRAGLAAEPGHPRAVTAESATRQTLVAARPNAARVLWSLFVGVCGLALFVDAVTDHSLFHWSSGILSIASMTREEREAYQRAWEDLRPGIKTVYSGLEDLRKELYSGIVPRYKIRELLQKFDKWPAYIRAGTVNVSAEDLRKLNEIIDMLQRAEKLPNQNSE
jgi:hypothetical protein